MEPEAVEQGIDHLERIEEELTEIKERTGGTRRAFVSGLFQGSGAVVGGILALAVLGLVLSLIGVIPGFGTIAAYLHGVVDQLHPGR